MRDTGDPTTSEGGMIEWGYYEETNPRLVHPRELLEKDQARLSPSQLEAAMSTPEQLAHSILELTSNARRLLMERLDLTITARTRYRCPFY